MLNIFPSFLDFGLLAPLILRAVVGVMFLRFGFKKLSPKHTEVCVTHFQALGINNTKTLIPLIGLLEVLGGLSLILGLYTQIAAIVLGLISLITYTMMRSKNAVLSHSQDFYFLLFVINLTLLITGAGVYAFDLPL